MRIGRGVAGLLLAALAFLPASGQQTGPSLTLALTGDSILTQRLSVYDEPDYLRLVALLRNADAALTNCEVLFHDYEAPAAPLSGGTYMAAPPALARELAWIRLPAESRR